MAFSKAKILRFNDIKSCAPPPGAYNPKYDDHVPGAVIYKDRGAEPCSPASSCCDIKSHTSATASVPSFRTPTIPRKKKFITLPNSAGKKFTSTKLFSPMKSEALREKIVECVNKDETIKELESQIEELKLAISNLKVEKDTIVSERDELLKKLKEIQDEYEDNLLKLKEQFKEDITHVNMKLSQSLVHNQTITDEFAAMKAELHAKNTEQMKEVQENLNYLEECLKQNLREAESMLKETEDKLSEKAAACSMLEKDLLKKCGQLRELEQRYEESLKTQADLQNSYAKDIESLKKMHQTEVEDLEYEMLKIVTEWQKIVEQVESDNRKKITELESHKTEELGKVTDDYDKRLNEIREATEAQIRQSEENCTEKIKLAEMQMEENRKEVEHSWRMKLKEQEEKSEEILKECQSIGEYSIIQCELEKNEIKQNLMETEKLVEQIRKDKQQISVENVELHKTVADLKTEMSSLIIELNSVREELGNEIKQREKELEEALREKHSYQVALNKTHATVNALKTRLLNSDRDVEQLKEELDKVESSKFEYEIKCNDLSTELDHVLEVNKNLTDSLKSVEERIIKTEADLLGKIDGFKAKADCEVLGLNKIIQEKQNTLDEVHSYLKTQQKLHTEANAAVSNAKVEIERLESENVDLKFKISRLESTAGNTDVMNLKAKVQKLTSINSDLQKEMALKDEILARSKQRIDEMREKLNKKENDVNEMANIYKKYIDQSGKYDDLQQKYEELLQKNQMLEQTVKEQNALIGPFREQLENYERDRLMLVAHKDEAEKEAREMGLKYAEILGHQNYKQKLKHIVDLKKRNIELKESKHECDSKILHQSRTIEKLKQEIAQLNKLTRKSRSIAPTDKENLCSPVKTPISNSRIDSPGNPLKERN